MPCRRSDQPTVGIHPEAREEWEGNDRLTAQVPINQKSLNETNIIKKGLDSEKEALLEKRMTTPSKSPINDLTFSSRLKLTNTRHVVIEEFRDIPYVNITCK